MSEKEDLTILHKEIDLIQSCINHMAQNSFLIKGWTISIIVVVLALTEKITDPIYLCLIMLIPIGSFWYLDSFFLQTEKMYRRMYQWVLQARKNDDFSYLYDLDPHRFCDQVESRWRIMWSVTLRVFYGIPLIIILLILVYQIFKQINCL